MAKDGQDIWLFERSTALLLGYCQKLLEATALLHPQMQKVLQRDEVLAVLAVLTQL